MSNSIDFAVIGAQKSATSYLKYELSKHPQILMPSDESTCFESPDYEYRRVEKQIGSLIRKREGRIVGIKRPNLLTEHFTAERLHEHSPNAKLIVCLRDPIERFVSAYFFMMWYGKIPPLEINEAIGLMIDSSSNYLTKHPRAIKLFHYGLYGSSLRHWSSIFNPSQVFVCSFKQVETKPDEIVARILNFLELDSLLDTANHNGTTNLDRKSNKKNVGHYSTWGARINNVTNFMNFSNSSGARMLERRNGIGWRILQVTVGKSFGKIARIVAKSTNVDPENCLNQKSYDTLNNYYFKDSSILKEIYPDICYWK